MNPRSLVHPYLNKNNDDKLCIDFSHFLFDELNLPITDSFLKYHFEAFSEEQLWLYNEVLPKYDYNFKSLIPLLHGLPKYKVAKIISLCSLFKTEEGLWGEKFPHEYIHFACAYSVHECLLEYYPDCEDSIYYYKYHELLFSGYSCNDYKIPFNKSPTEIFKRLVILGIYPNDPSYFLNHWGNNMSFKRSPLRRFLANKQSLSKEDLEIRSHSVDRCIKTH